MRVFMLLLTILGYFFLHYMRLQIVMVFSVRGGRAYLQRRLKHIARMIFALSSFFLDCRVVREQAGGITLPRQFMLVSNHQSLFDIPVLLHAFSDYGLRFVGKKELFRYLLLVSAIFRVQRHAKIDRKRDFANTMKEIERLGRMCSRMGYCPTVFPEGTRSRTGALGAFHSGAVRTILRVAPLPVVSVAIEGGYSVSTLRQVVTNLEHLRYRVKTMSVYPAPHSKGEVDAVLSSARSEIAEQLAEWRAATGNPVPV